MSENVDACLNQKNMRIIKNANLSFMWRLEGFGDSIMPSNIIQEVEIYTNCNQCRIPLPHCHCKCPYCGKLDECELFDAVTGG
ncbi:MAG: hypothetical protein ACE5R7_02425 [Nitrosarchaeum sp.]